MSEELKDYFEILGVTPDADAAAISEAYRRKAKETHPDRAGGNGEHEAFAELQAAYETLIDATLRESYVKHYSRFIGAKSLLLFEPSMRDLFDDAVEYVKDLSGFRRRDSFRLVLSKRYFGYDKRLSIEIPLVSVCSACKGFGAIAWLKCGECNGEGSTTTRREVEIEVSGSTPEGTVLTKELPDQKVLMRIEYR